ncbi:MAG: PIN domain-containing protein [Deltaproteobacteria bacterium]|nr:PIN domain-containing protein [Deltaproteobacteria bacterium]
MNTAPHGAHRLHLDTHVLVWLYAGAFDRLSQKAMTLLESELLCCSPMAVLELQYLFEAGMVTQPPNEVISALERRIGLVVTEAKTSSAVSEAIRVQLEDPFDRLIVADAALEQAPLLTRDETIRKSYSLAVWD